MTIVSDVTAELLRAGGIAAVAQGTVINLQAGPVGVSEACSGVKSLQASVMIGLAVGELFLLNPFRRVALLASSITLALLTNLLRTLALCLIVDRLGTDGFQRYHDAIGNAVLFVLPIAIWCVGKYLEPQSKPPEDELEPQPKQAAAPVRTVPFPTVVKSLLRLVKADWTRLPDFRPAAVIATIAFGGVHVWAIALDRWDPPYDKPIFTLNPAPAIPTDPLPLAPEIQQKLHPTLSDSITVASPDFPDGKAVCYHFFWAPQEENRYTASHRPDICMPAAGWKMANSVKPLTDESTGTKITWYFFDFESDAGKAMQLWAIWGNGHPLPIDFPSNLGTAAPKVNWSGIPGKHRPSVEVVSCVLNYRGTEPPIKQAMQLLRNVFIYTPGPTTQPPTIAPSPMGRNP